VEDLSDEESEASIYRKVDIEIPASKKGGRVPGLLSGNAYGPRITATGIFVPTSLPGVDIFVANDSLPGFTCHNRGDRTLEDSRIGIRRDRKHRLTGMLYEFNFDTMCEVSWN